MDIYCNSQLRTMEVASNECRNKYVSGMIVLTCSLHDCFMMLVTSYYLGLKESMGWTSLQHNSSDLPLQMAGLRFESVFTCREKEIMMWRWTATGLEIPLCKCETSKCPTPVIEPSIKIIQCLGKPFRTGSAPVARVCLTELISSINYGVVPSRMYLGFAG